MHACVWARTAWLKPEPVLAVLESLTFLLLHLLSHCRCTNVARQQQKRTVAYFAEESGWLQRQDAPDLPHQTRSISGTPALCKLFLGDILLNAVFAPSHHPLSLCDKAHKRDLP